MSRKYLRKFQKMTNRLSNSKKPAKRRAWPEKRRRAQAERIRTQQPWKQSTGPKTETGRSVAAQNAYKHGFRSRDMPRLRAVLRAQARGVKAALNRALNRG
jgi:hypothetical protein